MSVGMSCGIGENNSRKDGAVQGSCFLPDLGLGCGLGRGRSLHLKTDGACALPRTGRVSPCHCMNIGFGDRKGPGLGPSSGCGFSLG